MAGFGLFIGIAVIVSIINWMKENPGAAFVIGFFIVFVFFYVIKNNSDEKRDKENELANAAQRARNLKAMQEREIIDAENIRRADEARQAKLRKAEEVRKRQEEKELEKAKKEEDKQYAKDKSLAYKEFSIRTIQIFGLGKEIKIKNPPDERIIKFDLQNEQRIIVNKYAVNKEPNYFSQKKKFTALRIDDFLYSGMFGSVLGVEGFEIFKDQLLIHLQDQINNEQDKLYVENEFCKKLIFNTGIYYDYEFSSDHLKRIDDNYKWKGFQRLILMKKLSNDIKGVDLESFKKVFPKHFESFTEEDVKNLSIAISAISDDFIIGLTKYINNNYILKEVA